MARDETTVAVDGVEVRVSSPNKVLFPEQGYTKLDVVQHYIRCGDAALQGVRGRPCILKRWPKGVGGRTFFQKRVEQFGWKGDGADVTFPAAHPGRLPVVRTVADIGAMVQLGCIDLNPWPVRAADTDHPDEMRLDLDPAGDADFAAVRRAAAVVREILAEDGLTGWPKTSGSRGLHVYVRLRPEWTFHEIRRASLAIAREAERRLPGGATTAWWKEERRGVFLDFNQNARDKTVASVCSVRQTGLVSAPFAWDELDAVDPRDFPMDGFGDRLPAAAAALAGIDAEHGDLTPVLARVAADEERGLGDAPWPPHYPKQPGEPPRVNPSRRKRPPGGADG